MLDRLATVADDPQAVTDEELAECLVEIGRIEAHVLAITAKLTAAWDGRMVWAADGALSGGAWLARHAEVSRAQGHAQVRLARRLVEMPGTLSALQDGAIGAAKGRLLAGARRDDRVEQFAVAEAALIDHAQRFTVDQTARIVRHWLQVTEPDGGAHEAAAARERSEVHLSATLDGVHVLAGQLDPESGVIVRRQLDAIAREIYLAEREATGAPERTPAQRRAEALVEMARRSGALQAATGRPVRPTLLAICDLGVLHGDQGEPVPFGTICEIDGIGPIPAETARRLACNATITDVALGAEGKVLDVGRSSRLATSAQRKALLVRDQGCVFPGCDRQADWCEAHHVTEYRHGGATDLANLCLLCSRHHHLVHEGGFGLARGPDGLRVTRPDGTVIASHTPNHVPMRIRAPACERRPVPTGRLPAS
ncbi:MAG: endonuclease [Acidimicrobiales bacterium]|nr:endonuclease [Acidimicrobiales bacterium]